MVSAFFDAAITDGTRLYLSAVTVGELRRGVELIRHRGDNVQADLLEAWLMAVLRDYRHQIPPFDADVARVWGRLRVPHFEHAIDNQLAATALIYDLTLVTRNVADFSGNGVRLLNPFPGFQFQRTFHWLLPISCGVQNSWYVPYFPPISLMCKQL
jgi:predicted nucleic acid-binding protein